MSQQLTTNLAPVAMVGAPRALAKAASLKVRDSGSSQTGRRTCETLEIFREPGKAAFGGGASCKFRRVLAAQGTDEVPRFPWRFFQTQRPASFYETGPAKSEGKRFLDIGSGSSRRRLEEPLVEFSVGFVKSGDEWNVFGKRNERSLRLRASL